MACMRAFLLAASAGQRVRLMLPSGALSGVAFPVTSKYAASLACEESRDLGMRVSRANGVERRFCFLPLDARILNPEARIPTLAPVSHSFSVEELEPEVEAAHRAIFLKVPHQFVLQGIWVALLQWLARDCPGRRRRLLHDVNRAVTERHGAPIAELLIRLDRLARLRSVPTRAFSAHAAYRCNDSDHRPLKRVCRGQHLHGGEKCPRVVQRQGRGVLQRKILAFDAASRERLSRHASGRRRMDSDRTSGLKSEFTCGSELANRTVAG